MPLVAVKVKSGLRFDVYFLEEDGYNPMSEFLQALVGSDAPRMLRYIEKTASQGIITNPSQSKSLGNGMYYWRTEHGHGARAFYFTQPGRLIVCTHGYLKKKDKLKESETERAEVWRQKYLTAIRQRKLTIREELI